MNIFLLIGYVLSLLLTTRGQTCYDTTGMTANTDSFTYFKNGPVYGIFQKIVACSNYSPMRSFRMGITGCSNTSAILDWYLYFIDMNETDWETNQEIVYNSSLGIFVPNVTSQSFSSLNYDLSETGCSGDLSFETDSIYLTKYHHYAVYIVKIGDSVTFNTVPVSEESYYENAFTLEGCGSGVCSFQEMTTTFFITTTNETFTFFEPTKVPSVLPTSDPTSPTAPPAFLEPSVLPHAVPTQSPLVPSGNIAPSIFPTLLPTQPSHIPTANPSVFGTCDKLDQDLTGDDNYLISVNAQDSTDCTTTVGISNSGDYIKQYIDFGNLFESDSDNTDYYFLKQINIWIEPTNNLNESGKIHEYYISLKSMNSSNIETTIAETLTQAVEQATDSNSYTPTFRSFEFKEIGLLSYDITSDESNIDYFMELILDASDGTVEYPIYTCDRSVYSYDYKNKTESLATIIWTDESTNFECLNDEILAYEVEYISYYTTYDMKTTIESIITVDQWQDDYRWNLQDAASRAFEAAISNLTENDCQSEAECNYIVVCDYIELQISRRRLQSTTYTVDVAMGASMSYDYYNDYLDAALGGSFDSVNEQFNSIFASTFKTELNNFIPDDGFDTSDSDTFSFSIDSVELIDLSNGASQATTNGSTVLTTSGKESSSNGDSDDDDSSNEFVDLTSGDFFTVLGEAAFNGLKYDFATQLLFVIACLSFSLIIFGMVHNCATGTDSFDLWAIFFYALLTWDFFSDVFFAYQLYDWNSSSTTDTQIYSLMLYLSIGFVVVPLSLNLRALLRAQGDWSRHRVLGDRYRRYLNECGRPLFFLSILSGSAFATVHLINSNLFGWRIFSMGLSKQEITEFDQKRLINSIVLENIPQLCLQFWFAFQSDAISFVIMMAMLSSAISIMSAIWDHLSRRQTSDYQNISTVLYTVKVTSPFIRESRKNRNKFVHRRWKLQIELSELFGIDKTSVEVLQPSKFRDAHRGNGLIVNFWIVTTAISEDKLEQMMTDDYMMPDDKRGKQNTPSLPPSQLEQIRRQGNCPFARAVYSAWNRSLRAELGCVEAFDFQWANKFGGHTIRKDDNLGIMLSSSAFSESGTSPRGGATNNTNDSNGDTFGRTETGSTARLTDADALIAATNTSVKKSISQREGPKYDDNNTNNGSLAHPMTQMTNVGSASSGSVSGRDDDDDDAMIPTSEYKNIKPAKKGDAMNELEIQIMGDK